MSQHLKAQTQELMGIVTSPNKNHRTGHGLVPVSQVEQIGNFLRHCRQCFDTHPLWFILFITFYYLTLIEILVGYLYVKRREQPSPQFSVAPKGDTNCNNFALFSSVHYVQYIYIYTLGSLLIRKSYHLANMWTLKNLWIGNYNQDTIYSSSSEKTVIFFAVADSYI